VNVHFSHRQRGVSLIEVMMGTAILLVGFVGMIQAVTIGSESLDTARKQQIALQIAATEIEKLRASAWNTIASLPGSGTISINNAGTVSGDATSFFLANRTTVATDDYTELTTLARGFTCSFTRTFLRPTGASAATATFIKVIYTVRWTTNTGRTQNHQVDAYFAKSGLHLSHQQS
jgi:prepilin-type N-terminal cleavage/methylation domain-containing protein